MPTHSVIISAPMRHRSQRLWLMRKMLERPLPEFENPPVVEVALSVQFSAPVLEGPLLMLRWGQVRDRFPQYEQVPPLPATSETFDGPKGMRFEFQLSNTPPTPRIFMVSESNAKVLQVQENMFGYSWRKLRPEHEYPRYSKIVEDFKLELVEFEKFLSDEGLSELSPSQCEVTYLNHIFPEGVWDDHSNIDKVVPSTAPRLTEEFLPLPEQIRYASQYVIHDENHAPIGRLYVSVEPRHAMDGETPICVMSLTVRCKPQGPDINGIIKTMDIGHEWIVRGFATLTSTEMHDAWRRLS